MKERDGISKDRYIFIFKEQIEQWRLLCESKDREIAELKAEREKLAYRITDLLNESIDSGMEIRKLKADILNFKEWYREANAATRVQVLEKLNKIA